MVFGKEKCTLTAQMGEGISLSPYSLKQLLDNRMQQTHVLGASDRQPVYRVVVHHFWYRGERLAELAQNVLACVRLLLDSHVHKTTSTPENIKYFQLIKQQVWLANFLL